MSKKQRRTKPEVIVQCKNDQCSFCQDEVCVNDELLIDDSGHCVNIDEVIKETSSEEEDF